MDGPAVEYTEGLPVGPTLTVRNVVRLEFHPCGASPVKGFAEGSGVDQDSVSVLVKILDVVDVRVNVLKPEESGIAPLGIGEYSGTGETVMAEVLTTKEAVAGGVLPPSQLVEPLCSAKEYGPSLDLTGEEVASMTLKTLVMVE